MSNSSTEENGTGLEIAAVERDDAPSIDSAIETREVDVPDVTTSEYDPTKSRELTRAAVVFALILLLAVVVLAPLVAILFFDYDFERIQAYMTLVFGSLTTMVGTALGFYYGERR